MSVFPGLPYKFHRYFFGGGSPSIPSVPAPAPIAPAPAAQPSQPAGQNLEGRARQVAMLKYGALSTISNQGGAAGLAEGVEMYPTMTSGTQGRQTTGGS